MTQVKSVQHWRVVSLGNVCSLRAEGIHPSEMPDARYVGLEHIESGNPTLSRWGLATEVNSSKSQFYIGDVLYGKLRPYLDKAVLAEFNGICSTDILVLHPSEAIASDFLVQLLHTGGFVEHATKTTRGVNHPRTSWSSLVEFKFPLPPLAEQRAIARALESVQQAKDARQHELDVERERKAVLMQHLFTYGTRGESTKQTEIGEMPKSWQVVPLGEIVTLQRGRDLPVQERKNGNVPVIGANGIVGWHDTLAENVPIPGLATGRSGSIGLLTYMPQSYWPLNTVLYVSDFHGNNPLFVYYWLHMFDFKKYSQGVSVPTLNRNLVHPVPYPLPPLQEQREIALVLNACDNKIAALEHEINQLTELFQAMLEELMTGRLSAVSLIEGGNGHE